MTTPVDPYVRLGQVARDLGAEVEFQLISFVLIPDLDGDQHGVRCVFRTDTARLNRTEEQRHDEAELEAMMQATRQAEQRVEFERVRQQAADLAEKLKDPGKGIL